MFIIVDPTTYTYAKDFSHFSFSIWTVLRIRFTSNRFIFLRLAAGLAIGIVCDAEVKALGQQETIFVGMNTYFFLQKRWG